MMLMIVLQQFLLPVASHDARGTCDIPFVLNVCWFCCYIAVVFDSTVTSNHCPFMSHVKDFLVCAGEVHVSLLERGGGVPDTLYIVCGSPLPPVSPVYGLGLVLSLIKFS